MSTHPYLPTHINLSHLRDLTIEHGEGWGYPHVSRVLSLIGEIGVGLDYDQDVILYAAYLHDWGAFPRYRRAGVEHALRSVQIAELEILPHTTLTAPARGAVLDAIALHDYRDLRPAAAAESLLLREADMLDMLGMVGLLREFSWGPRDMKVPLERVIARMQSIPTRLSLPRARVIAAERMARMEQALCWYKEESFEEY
jgi:uncharacterized protein